MANNITIINGIVRHGTDYFYASDIESVHIMQSMAYVNKPKDIHTNEDIKNYMYTNYKVTEYTVDTYGAYICYNTGKYYIKIHFKHGTVIAGEAIYKNIDDAEDAVIEIMSYSTKPFIDKI